MNSWQYNGGTITLVTHSGTFVADLPSGKRVSGPSLDAVKKKIRDAGKPGPEGFAFVGLLYGEKKSGTIVGTARGRYRRLFWRDAKGVHHERIIRATPENVKALDAYMREEKRLGAARSKLQAQAEKLFDQMRKLEQALPWERPE